jgi:ABC-2 type transport system ATP-binding protein
VDAPAIRVAGIRKVYGTTVAVADVSFEVEPGEIFGLIGPNGAGKTTTMECVGGLQQRVGVQLQQAQLQKRIKVWEAVDLWASLYPHHVDGEQLLARLGLADKRNAWFMTLSGGQKQRLFIALALIHDPDVVLLDELTTGLDPQARRAIWDMVRGIRARQDGAADDAPDGRGREAVRPRGHHRARHGGGHRNAGRPGAAVLPRAGRRADHGRRPGA